MGGRVVVGGIGLALLFGALFVTAPASVGAQPGTSARFATAAWCGAGAVADDRPDVVAGKQIHVVYAIPADGADRFNTVALEIVRDVTGVDGWWRREDPTRAPRFDLASFPGCGAGFDALDISSVRLTGSTSSFHTFAGRFSRIAAELSRLFLSNHKKYLVYYDGEVETYTCGQATADLPNNGGTFAFVYLRNPWCTGDYNAKVAAHELLHGLGAVPAQAPHGCPNDYAHVCEHGLDVMHGLGTEDGTLANRRLDVGRDDYYGHSGAWWDVQDSLWLRRLDRPAQTLSVTLAGATAGASVTSDAPGIDCPQTCSSTWDGGEKVRLAANPGLDARVVGWTGACTGQDGACEVTMDQARSTTVVFGPLEFNGRVAVAGRGKVTNADTGLSCARSCTKRFGAGETFAFRAVPAKGWAFAGWKGACRGRAATCRVRFDADRSLHATFRRR